MIFHIGGDSAVLSGCDQYTHYGEISTHYGEISTH